MIAQNKGDEEYFESVSKPALSTSRGVVAWSSSDGRESSPVDSLVRQGRTMEFHLDEMEVDRPYPFWFKETWLIAVRRAAGHIDFLSLT